MGLLQRRLGANLIRVYFWSGKAVGQIGSRHAQDTQVMTPSRRKHAHENTQNTFIIIGFFYISCLSSSNLQKSEGRMTIWEGEFTVTKPLDTFLSLPGWHKGVAFLNGFNLGRYWYISNQLSLSALHAIFCHRPAVGPQMTLYVPATLLKTGTNMLILLEQDHSPCLDHPEHCHVEFVDKPEINGPTPT